MANRSLCLGLGVRTRVRVGVGVGVGVGLRFRVGLRLDRYRQTLLLQALIITQKQQQFQREFLFIMREDV